jgi:predicted nucleotidyltransferase
MNKSDLPRALLGALDKALEGPLSGYRPLHVFLFGSRAQETPDRRSDFDIGVDAGRPLAARDLVELRETFDSAPLLARVDVVDFARVDDAFRRHALRSMVPLYDRAA